MPNGCIGRFRRSTMAHDMERRSLKVSTPNRPTDRQVLRTTAVAAAGQPCHDTSSLVIGLAGRVAWIAQGGLVYYLGSPPTGVPTGRRVKRRVSWICLNGI